MKRLVWLLVVSCRASGEPSHAPGASVAGPDVTAPNGARVEAAAAGPAKRTGKLTIAEARAYMVELVNRDRATMKLAPVALDLGPPTTAGQRHAEDMAHLGYLGHWGSDGSTPEQRLTEAGGADLDLENALCMTDMKERALDPSPKIDAKAVEDAEAMFFNEVPPHDGHRQNILKPAHNKLGIGVAQPLATATELPTACFSQEFLDAYGTYAPVPAKAKVGATLHVEATLVAPAVPGGIGLARVDAPTPLSAAVLNTRRTYQTPTTYQNYWPKGFETPIPITVEGQSLRGDVPLSDGGKPGLYEVSIWAKMPGRSDFAQVSVRTIVVER